MSYIAALLHAAYIASVLLGEPVVGVSPNVVGGLKPLFTGDGGAEAPFHSTGILREASITEKDDAGVADVLYAKLTENAGGANGKPSVTVGCTNLSTASAPVTSLCARAAHPKGPMYYYNAFGSNFGDALSPKLVAAVSGFRIAKTGEGNLTKEGEMHAINGYRVNEGARRFQFKVRLGCIVPYHG